MLVLYDGSENRGPGDNMVAQGFQLVFDYWGLIPYYREVKQPLPDDALMAETCAIVTTLSENAVPQPRPYLPWLIRQMEAGKRVMILGFLGASIVDGADLGEVARLRAEALSRLGVTPASLHGLDRRVFRYARRLPGGIDFERRLPPQPRVSTLFEQTDPALTVFLSVTHPDRPGKEFPAVFVGAAGGFAEENDIYWEEAYGRPRRKWLLNPFAFAEACLGIAGRIAPDVTTLNGVRIAFSHVDADGFAGLSRVDGKSLCAEALRDAVWAHYDFPVTLSVIQADVDPEIAADPKLAKRAQAVARGLFALPNVEPGSHTFSHPYYWNSASKTRTAYEDRFPYTIPGYTFDAAREIDGSMRFISALSPPDKPCRVLQWSGDCRPTASQVARVDALGFLNINGGDTMYDGHNDSLTSVSPMFRVVGDRIQFFTAAANENVMTNLWKGPFYGYRNMIQTFERTESPRRLKPINMYYHCFSGELPASLRAVQDVNDWVARQPVARLFTSQYLEMARDYLRVRLYRLGTDAYAVEDYGRCLTMRLPADAPAPNLARSENVLGYSRQAQGLYVSLAPGAARAVISLAPADPGAERVYLRTATGFVSGWSAARDGASLDYRGFGEQGGVALAGFAPGTVVRAGGSALAAPLSLTADPEGVVRVSGVRSGRLEVGP
ncbi:MAG: hypothetical protein AB7D57_12170 [Desulfovibrionaceae bacterium]